MDATNSIYRDRTIEFFKLRSASLEQNKWLAGNGQVSEQDIAAQNAKNEDLEKSSGPPPSWVRAVESFVEIERSINSKMELLVASQREVFAPKFGISEEEAEEQEDQVVQYNKDVQNFLKEAERLATNVVQLRDSATVTERRAAENVQKHLSTRLANLLVAFRKAQSGYTSQLKKREEQKAKFRRVKAEDASTHERLEKEEKVTGYLAQGYTEAEVSELLFMEEQKREQNAQITQLMESVQEVHQMFADLRDMVVEQGTMLDRIDYNLEKTSTHMAKGLEQLHKAREQQKKCIIM